MLKITQKQLDKLPVESVIIAEFPLDPGRYLQHYDPDVTLREKQISYLYKKDSKYYSILRQGVYTCDRMKKLAAGLTIRGFVEKFPDYAPVTFYLCTDAIKKKEVIDALKDSGYIKDKVKKCEKKSTLKYWVDDAWTNNDLEWAAYDPNIAVRAEEMGQGVPEPLDAAELNLTIEELRRNEERERLIREQELVMRFDRPVEFRRAGTLEGGLNVIEETQ